MQEVSQICPPHCAFPYRLLDKIVHYSEMSKTRKSPRKSLPERWEPYQKRAGTVSPTCGGMMHGGSSVFRTYHRGGALPSHDSLQRLTSDRQQEPLVCTAVRISDVCSKLAYTLLCGDAPCAWDTSRRARKSRTERRVRRHGSIYRTWAGVEHFPHTHIRAPFSVSKCLVIREYGK